MSWLIHIAVHALQNHAYLSGILLKLSTSESRVILTLDSNYGSSDIVPLAFVCLFFFFLLLFFFFFREAFDIKTKCNKMPPWTSILINEMRIIQLTSLKKLCLHCHDFHHDTPRFKKSW